MDNKSRIACAMTLSLLLVGCATGFKPGTEKPQPTSHGKTGEYVVFGQEYAVLPESRGYLEIGVASWYGEKFHGRLTANGETYDMHDMTAAHKALPLPTFVKVTNLDNMRSTILRVNDRGPFHDDRLIDLSYEAARVLGFVDKGIAPVVVEAVDHMNYAVDAEPAMHGASYYLQLGAFTNRDGAEALLASVKRLAAADMLASIEVNILESEVEQRILHKVWIGPVASSIQADELALLVESANLGRPLRITLQ